MDGLSRPDGFWRIRSHGSALQCAEHGKNLFQHFTRKYL